MISVDKSLKAGCLLRLIKDKLDSLFLIFSPIYERLFYFPGDIANYFPEGVDLSSIEDSFFDIDEETRIHYQTLRPSGRAIARVLHCHGSGFNVTKHFSHINWLVSYGYEVTMFDYPGYGKSTGKPTRKSTIKSTRLLLDHISQDKSLPVFILGQSLGANIAAVIAACRESQPVIKGCILDSMYSSFRRLGRQKIKRKIIGKIPFISNLLSFFISDYQAPWKLAFQIRCPILLIHSRNDPIVPLQESIDFYMRVSSSDCLLVSDGIAGHTEVLRGDLGDFRRLLVTWMNSRS